MRDGLVAILWKPVGASDKAPRFCASHIMTSTGRMGAVRSNLRHLDHYRRLFVVEVVNIFHGRIVWVPGRRLGKLRL